MTSTFLRRCGVGILSLAAVAAAVAAGAPTASAATTGFTAASPVILGDLTGDGVTDRVTLGSVPTTTGSACAYQLKVGRGGGGYGAPTVGLLPVQDTVDPGDSPNCPDLGVVVKGPTPKQNRLAVAWFQLFPSGGTAPYVQLFAGFGAAKVTYTGGVAGENQPSVIASKDFDGDGWGDIWENTDQGDGFTAYVGRNNSWHRLYGTPFTNAATPQFFDFNRAGGVDVLVTWADFGNGAGAAVVDGRTGAVQTLASATSDNPTTFDASVVDVDHDSYPDIQVVETPTDGPTVVQRYLNRSQGGRWYFPAVPRS